MLISDGFLRGYSPLLVSSAFSFAAIMRAAPAYVGRLSRDRMNDSVLSEFPPMNEIFKSVIGFGDSDVIVQGIEPCLGVSQHRFEFGFDSLGGIAFPCAGIGKEISDNAFPRIISIGFLDIANASHCVQVGRGGVVYFFPVLANFAGNGI